MLLIIQILSAAILIVLILMQSRGTGFNRSFSSSSFTRRGVEKLVFRFSFIVAAVFIVVSIIQLTV